MNYIITYTIYVLIISVLMGLTTWKLFKKMGYNPLFSFVPFYNYYIILTETEHPKWWAILSYLPIVGPIMMSAFHIFLMKKFGKRSALDGLLTVILPFIFMATVNYGKDPQVETEEEEEEGKKKETFVGSVTFAVVFATIIHAFITQPFGIPTGSMERTLLVGDFLFVNKWAYGYRMPMRPVALPFLQGTIFDTGQKGNPKDDPKSYVDAVKLPYLRIPGYDEVERYDIVVFNYPQDSVHTAIDRKDPYVKRCVGIPGDVIEFRAGRLFVNNAPEKILGDEYQQHRFIVRSNTQLDIPQLYKAFGFLPVRESQDNGFLYEFQGLTDEMRDEIKKIPSVESIEEDIMQKGKASVAYYKYATGSEGNYLRDKNGEPIPASRIDSSNSIYPVNKPWNQDWYGPLRIPKKGDVVKLDQETLPMYKWIISEYEHNKLENKGGKIYVNGQETNQYTIKQNYYMMIGDNRDASLDARFFGVVPEENIVGRPMFTWMSVEGLFADANSTYQAPGKKIRWDRMFKATNTGEANKTSYWWVAVLILVLFFGWDFFANLFKKKKEED
ncbi:signal peptidase I [Epilithonimonas lactis]|uniref:Signal peptidase I n=1 Tax=Epilithonimonas lactis TaxID=421072 RepID=A0A085BKT8_9FLAO|nr:signal peptidase I [Epilithonimonas lactis]KFC18584.1 signal peptidase I [Epilithonimonas lactis]KFC23083.1 signal peptidase I [Epilithonimonas lactis]SEQ67874.1 signal peptidase I [Epilithonimonas lactis]